MGDIRERFEKNIKAHTKPNEKLAVAVSGGADSMCLLSLALNAPFIKKQNLRVVSVDHQIRAESAHDVQFVQEFCLRHGVTFLPYAVNVPALAKKSGASLETAAREARKKIFALLVAEKTADKVLTAHHASDNAESIFMHLLRGCGLQGLCGMEMLHEGFLLRPLLDVQKDEIVRYISQNELPFTQDETNTDNTYTRNFIRNEILPRIKQRYTGAENALINLSQDARTALAFIDAGAAGQHSAVQDGVYTVSLDKLKNPAAAARHITHALPPHIARLLQRKHIELIIALQFADEHAGIDLPAKFRAVKQAGSIVLFSKSNKFSKTEKQKS
ncbi:MAG: tRNA lysidine(34) synthetase TilS [Firmicutes bacterium]|nr:tRNA lysidine(34) synthetase TilS [Bacillota bacterium]